MKEDEVRHFEGKVSQKVIIQYGERFLVCRGLGDALWEFPGGRLNNNEDPQDSLLREVKEELNISIYDVRPIYVGRSLHVKSNTWRVLITYHAKASDDVVAPDRDEIEDARWVTREDLETLSLFEDCREAVNEFMGVV